MWKIKSIAYVLWLISEPMASVFYLLWHLINICRSIKGGQLKSCRKTYPIRMSNKETWLAFPLAMFGGEVSSSRCSLKSCGSCWTQASITSIAFSWVSVSQLDKTDCKPCTFEACLTFDGWNLVAFTPKEMTLDSLGREQTADLISRMTAVTLLSQHRHLQMRHGMWESLGQIEWTK